MADKNETTQSNEAEASTEQELTSEEMEKVSGGDSPFQDIGGPVDIGSTNL